MVLPLPRLLRGRLLPHARGPDGVAVVLSGRLDIRRRRRLDGRAGVKTLEMTGASCGVAHRRLLLSVSPLPFQQPPQLIHSLFRRSVARVVVFEAAANGLTRGVAVVHVGDLDAARAFLRQLLVGQEVVLQAVYQTLWRFADVLDVAVGHVLLQHGDDLVVGLVAVNHAQAADGLGAHQEVGVRGGALREHADVHRVAVAAYLLAAGAVAAEFGHAVAAEGLRDEAVQGGRERGEALRAVEAQVARRLVQLVLDRVGRHDLDVGVDHAGRALARRDAVPRVRLKHEREQAFEPLLVVGHLFITFLPWRERRRAKIRRGSRLPNYVRARAPVSTR